jgi:hypothetical protein
MFPRGIGRTFRNVIGFAIVGAIVLCLAGCERRAAWEAKNEKLIADHGLKVRVRTDLPKSGPVPSLAPGVVVNYEKLPET